MPSARTVSGVAVATHVIRPRCCGATPVCADAAAVNPNASAATAAQRTPAQFRNCPLRRPGNISRFPQTGPRIESTPRKSNCTGSPSRMPKLPDPCKKAQANTHFSSSLYAIGCVFMTYSGPGTRIAHCRNGIDKLHVWSALLQITRHISGRIRRLQCRLCRRTATFFPCAYPRRARIREGRPVRNCGMACRGISPQSSRGERPFFHAAVDNVSVGHFDLAPLAECGAGLWRDVARASAVSFPPGLSRWTLSIGSGADRLRMPTPRNMVTTRIFGFSASKRCKQPMWSKSGWVSQIQFEVAGIDNRLQSGHKLLALHHGAGVDQDGTPRP